MTSAEAKPATSSLVTGHTSGLTYRSHYWGENYTVTAVHEDGSVTAHWHRQNQRTTHTTSRLPGGPAERDQEVVR